jgi:hypothetical protein
MNFCKLSLTLSTAALLACAASLHAAPISFSWTAVALPDSNLNGQTFSGNIIFTGVSDTTLAEPNPIGTGNYGFDNVGPLDFSIPSLNATGIIADTANVLSFPSGLLKFNLTPNGVTSDAADLMFSNLGATDFFNTSQTVSGSQFVEANGTAPVSSAVINGVRVLNISLGLDTDPSANATFVETVGAPEPASWTILLASAFVLLPAVRRVRGTA